MACGQSGGRILYASFSNILLPHGSGRTPAFRARHLHESAMKPLFAALMAGLLSGCAAESWRFAEERPRPLSEADRMTLDNSARIRQTALSPTAAPADSIVSTDREVAESWVHQSSKRPKGLI